MLTIHFPNLANFLLQPQMFLLLNNNKRITAFLLPQPPRSAICSISAKNGNNCSSFSKPDLIPAINSVDLIFLALLFCRPSFHFQWFSLLSLQARLQYWEKPVSFPFKWCCLFWHKLHPCCHISKIFYPIPPLILLPLIYLNPGIFSNPLNKARIIGITSHLKLKHRKVGQATQNTNLPGLGSNPPEFKRSAAVVLPIFY